MHLEVVPSVALRLADIGQSSKQSVELLANGARAMAERAIAGMTINEARLAEQLGRNPILVTALNRRIGYERGAEIAKRAYAQGSALIDVAVEMTDLRREELERLLDPAALTRPGTP